MSQTVKAERCWLPISRILGYVQLQKPGKDSWHCLLETETQSQYMKIFKDCGFDVATVLFAAKCVQRLVNCVINNWRSKPEFPRDKDNYISKVKDVQDHWKTEVTALTESAKLKEPEKHIRKVNEMPSTTLVHDYYAYGDKRKQIEEEFKKLEDHLKENGNILWLGDGRRYNREVAKSWSSVIRYLGFISMSQTWRK